MRYFLLSGTAAALALVCATSSVAAAPPAPSAQAVDRTHLDALVKAADAIDGGADAKGLLAAREAALAEGERLYPPGAPERGALLADLAGAYFYNGDMKTAIARMESGLALLEKGGEAWNDKYRSGRGDLAVMYNYVGRHAEARGLFEADYEWQRGRFGPPETATPSLGYATSINNLAASDFEAGDVDGALARNAEALAMSERLKPVPPEAVIWYANRVTYLATAGRIDDAVDAARLGQARIESILPPNHPYIANNLSNFAALLLLQGRPGEAMDMSRRAFELQEKGAGKVTQNSAAMRIVYARAMIAKGDFAGAEAFLASAIPTLEAQVGADSDRTQTAIETRAQAMSHLGRAAEALAIEEKVVASRETRLPAGHRDRMFGHETLADIALTGGDLRRAVAELGTAVAMRAKVQPAGHPDLLAGRARLLAYRTRLAADPALAAEGESLLAALTDSSRREIDRASLEEVRDGFANVAEAAIRLHRPDLAFVAMQYASRSSADDAVAAAAARTGLAARPELAAVLRQRQDVLRERKQLLDAVQRQMQKPDPAYDLAKVNAASADIDRRLAAADARLTAAGLSGAGRFQAAPLAAVQGRLAAREALWMATRLPSGYAVMAVGGGQAAMAIVDPKADVPELVRRVRATLDPAEGGGSVPFARADARRLYTALAPAPVARLLAGRTHLIVAANGPLSSLPFAVLVPSAQPGYLIDRTAISHVPGPASLLRAAPGSAPMRQASFLGFGSPNGGGAAGAAFALRSAGDARTLAELPALPHSAAELSGLARAVGAARPRIFVGPAATEAALRDQVLAAGGILAFATHGLVSGELEGLREPALVLTPAGEDDGLLTASEIARLSLPASWVILSACDTAAGAGPDAPGLTGLAQAFLFAGTRNLLATHWPVRDDVATRLTTGTLGRASAGLAPAEALRQSILALRRDPKLRGAASPSVWAPFVLIE